VELVTVLLVFPVVCALQCDAMSVARPLCRVEPLSWTSLDTVGLWKAIVTSSLHFVDRQLTGSCGFLVTACLACERLSAADVVFWSSAVDCFLPVCVVGGFVVPLALSVAFSTLLFCVVFITDVCRRRDSSAACWF